MGLQYATLGIVEVQKQKLNELRGQVDHLLKTYQLGHKSNPVGYSGLLGMKSLMNCLSGLENQYEAQKMSSREQLTAMGLGSSDLKPIFNTVIEFVNQYFPK